MQLKRNKSLIISYMQLRSLIGIFGIILPLICIADSIFLEKIAINESISIYYYYNIRDIFVGVMLCASSFFITYKGYDCLDSIITTITGVGGFVLALFPCENQLINSPVGFLLLKSETSNYFHVGGAFLFFVSLAITSLFLFTKSKDKVPRGVRKYYRNIIYRTTGIIIIISLVLLIIIFAVIDDSKIKKSKTILILEIIMLFSYGISWLIKGGTLLKDKSQLTTAST